MCDMTPKHISKYTSIDRYIQGGEDPSDALSCRSFSAKEPLIIGLFSAYRVAKTHRMP